MGRELKISIRSGSKGVLELITPVFPESPSFAKSTKKYLLQSFSPYIFRVQSLQQNRIKSRKRLIFTMCLYQRDAGNQKPFSFCEASLYLAGYSILKEMKKIKRQDLSLAIF